MRLHRCYPVYECGYKRQLRTVTDYLDGLEGLSAIGRNGAFKDNNQDHSILMGLLVAENLLEHREHNLWGPNSDYESYQEAAMIDDSGLVPLGA